MRKPEMKTNLKNNILRENIFVHYVRGSALAHTFEK